MRRLLIVGCGDVGSRLLPWLSGRYRLYALSRSARQQAWLRAQGVVPLAGDLDHPASLASLAGLAHDVLHFAPPPNQGLRDSRTTNLIRVLRKGRSIPQRLLYISTSGVYGDCAGEVVHEHRRVQPQTERAQRRVDAEWQLRRWARVSGVALVILRVPGIYAANRLPLERIRAGIPALTEAEDAYTNHIHADDLARVVVAALNRGRSNRVYHAADGSWLKMGDYFDLVAKRFGLPCPPRVSRLEAQQRIPSASLSFMRESRRLENWRLRRELRVRLRYPSVEVGVAQAFRAAAVERAASAAAPQP